MYFLVQITIKNDGTVSQGTSKFDTMKEAITQFHIAMASAMSKENITKFTCVILNQNGLTQKVEVYENIAPSPEPVEEETVELVSDEIVRKKDML